MSSQTESPQSPVEEQPPQEARLRTFHSIQFRPGAPLHTVAAELPQLQPDEVIMVGTDHGPEPARVVAQVARWPEDEGVRRAPFSASRRATRDEADKYEKLGEMERTAFETCAAHIERLRLAMHLVRVERFFSGGKIIFYFTAESRVDFRELVKCLVQEFRTRVEMRQIGVRHETKMVGGLGSCGRELCCSSYIKNFESVSIKMAKEQNLPLNPAKISGACNRLLCCLNYEFKTYKEIRKGMPKIGRRIMVNDKPCKVRRHNVLQETIQVQTQDGEELILSKEQWQAAKAAPAPKEK